MTNITLSIDDNTYNKMKSYSEIKWSDFVRKSIQKRIDELDTIQSNVSADVGLLSENWMSEEDVVAWRDL